MQTYYTHLFQKRLEAILDSLRAAVIELKERKSQPMQHVCLLLNSLLYKYEEIYW